MHRVPAPYSPSSLLHAVSLDRVPKTTRHHNPYMATKFWSAEGMKRTNASPESSTFRWSKQQWFRTLMCRTSLGGTPSITGQWHQCTLRKSPNNRAFMIPADERLSPLARSVTSFRLSMINGLGQTVSPETAANWQLQETIYGSACEPKSCFLTHTLRHGVLHRNIRFV